jgi:hypothetical protein
MPDWLWYLYYAVGIVLPLSVGLHLFWPERRGDKDAGKGSGSNRKK